jgi:hypothetical protein
MKTNKCDSRATRRDTSFGVSLNSCRQLLEQVGAVKESLLREFGEALEGYEQVLRAALNEAEALAWQTPYPHLVFPVLAREKALFAREWAAHQQWVRQASLPMAA